jgi:hypothetical protein
MTQTGGSDNFIKLTNTTNSTSNTTGSIISTGGLGITKSAVIGGNLNVHGNIHANGAISADGSITLGDTATDNIVLNADINSSIIPNTNGSFDIGNSTQYWSNGFFESIKLTAAADLGMTTLEIDANDADQAALTIDGEQTTIAVMRIDADALTTNSAAVFDDNSADTSTRASVQIVQDNAAALAATALKIQSDGGITGMQIDKNYTDVSAATVTGLHVDFDRTVPGSGTAAFTDIGIDLDVNSAGLGVTTTTGLDIDVVGATSGTHTATGMHITVGSADTNYALITTGGNVGIGVAAPASLLSVSGTVQVGVDDTGYDVKFFGDTSGNYWLWDTSADGSVQVGTLTVGVDDTGHDVKFFGATSGAYLEWDESADELEIRGGAATPGKLLLSTAETTVVDGNKLGQIDFQAPIDSAGTDAILVGASIFAEADATFSSSVNSTDLVFATGDSAAATEKFRIDSTGTCTFADGSIDVNIASHDTSNGLKLGGTLVTATAVELNYSDGVTSAIQTQMDTKASTGKAIAMAMVFGG